MKRKVSFHESATIHYTPLPTPEEKQACFYSLDEIAGFRNQVESEAWQEYLNNMMDQPLTNPFHPRPQDDENDADDERENNPSSPTRALHRSDTVQDHLSHLVHRNAVISEEDAIDEDSLEQSIIGQVGQAWPILFGPSAKGACHQVTKQSLTLVAGLCILAYLYTN
jgi:hypothetical protein